jgi:hypothetical protein
VVVPDADGTLFLMPPQLKPELSVLMADVFPTGLAFSWGYLGLTVDGMPPRAP